MRLRFLRERPKHRRIKRLDIEADMFLEILRALDGRHSVRVENLIPDDARIVALTVSKLPNTISLFVESMLFEEVDPTLIWPEWEVQISVSETAPATAGVG